MGSLMSFNSDLNYINWLLPKAPFAWFFGFPRLIFSFSAGTKRLLQIENALESKMVGGLMGYLYSYNIVHIANSTPPPLFFFTPPDLFYFTNFPFSLAQDGGLPAKAPVSSAALRTTIKPGQKVVWGVGKLEN